MKKIFIFILVVGVFFSNESLAQTTQETDVIKSILKMAKRDFFAVNMDLTEDQAALFWPIYDEYDSKKSKMISGQVSNLKKLIVQQDFSEKEINEIISTVKKLEVQSSKLRHTYYNKIRKKVGLLVGVEFFQLDEFVSTELKAYIMENLSLEFSDE
ncbi:hypothetical protein [Aureibacter tunicatorum]|uniref:Spy/CpxP family protein refolding chaperone n=1 Tax=Aureibacter tunicatorum TaxID=866807 RepID=A0AAE3XQ65_9BACT|nr:hypothetical protein [Aureibacter tunicatorum]MDR6240547.1 Spy/CpxP family protein refolding chaperone [Aureibacter tunicatorum]BDD06592.1 hypothetical protein AUTU_40750 [Aureibacter tunicatorum]